MSTPARRLHSKTVHLFSLDVIPHLFEIATLGQIGDH